MLTLKGRAAVVTGAAAGIGFAIAKMFAENGMQVAILDINGEKAQTAAEELTASGGDAVGIPCDVSDVSSIREAVERRPRAFRASTCSSTRPASFRPRTSRK
jgi:3-oxoacyl-[acyl-carrier protein] reductase